MNRIKTTTTTTGTGNITTASTFDDQCRPLSDAPVGAFARIMIRSATQWEFVECTILSTTAGETTFSRDNVLLGAAGPGVKNNFTAGVKDVFVVGDAIVNPEIPFSATIPLNRPEIAYMAPYTLTGPLAFAAGAKTVTGAHVVATIIGNGVDEPTFPGFVKHGNPLPFNKAAGIKNRIQFLRFPDATHYAISQAAADVVATVPVPTAVTMTGSNAGVVNTVSGTFSVNTDKARTAAVIVTPTPVAGVTFNPTSVTLPIGSAAGTFNFTPTTTGAKVIAVTNDSGLTNPNSITYTVTAAATAPAQMAAPVATQTGATTASVALAAPNNGGSAITGYTVVSNPAGGVDSNAGTTSLTHSMTGLTTGQAYTFTATATNPVGTSPASPASNSVTPAVPAATPQYPRMVDPAGSGSLETGPAPYDYTKVGSPEQSGVFDIGFGNNADGSITMQLNGGNFQAFALGLVTSKQPVTGGTSGAAQMLYAMDAIYHGPSSTMRYNTYDNGVQTATANTMLDAQLVRISRNNGTFKFEFSNVAGDTWTTLATFAGLTGAYMVQLNSGTMKDVIGSGLI